MPDFKITPNINIADVGETITFTLSGFPINSSWSQAITWSNDSKADFVSGQGTKSATFYLKENGSTTINASLKYNERLYSASQTCCVRPPTTPAISCQSNFMTNTRYSIAASSECADSYTWKLSGDVKLVDYSGNEVTTGENAIAIKTGIGSSLSLSLVKNTVYS